MYNRSRLKRKKGRFRSYRLKKGRLYAFIIDSIILYKLKKKYLGNSKSKS